MNNRNQIDIIIVGPINLLHAKPGGIRSYIINLARELRKRNINTTLIGLSSGECSDDFKFISIIENNKHISGITFLLNLMIKVPFLKIPPNSVIHVQRPEYIFPFLIYNRKNPKIITVHGRKNEWDFILMKGKMKGLILNLIDDLLIPMFDIIIGINDDTNKYYRYHNPKLKDRIFVIPTGIDIDLFKPNENVNKNKYGLDSKCKTILYIGRFVKIKGLDLLLHAANILQEKKIKFQLVLVGEGPEKLNLKRIIKEMNLENILLFDTIDHDEIPDIINCADVFALCSSGEGMPTVVLESLACGVPVVSTKVGDVHKVVINGISGYLVEKRTPQEIAMKLIEALNNGSALKNNCINISREYSWNIIGNKIVSVYEEAIKKRNIQVDN